MKPFAVLVFVAMLVTPAAVLACESHASAKSDVKQLSVAELASLMNRNKVVVLDVNGAEARAKFGVIPGATLISHYVNHDVARELPASKRATLVFYCGSTHCSASHEAAKRAIQAGYEDVRVLSTGIKGWKAAGQPVQDHS